MSFYHLCDIRESDLQFGTLSMGNIPIRVEYGRIEGTDPNNAVPRTDPDNCDTPNLSTRICDVTAAEYLRVCNHLTRRQGDSFLERHLGRKDSAPFCLSHDNPIAQAVASFFGRFNQAEIAAACLPIRPICRNANTRIPTEGDPVFRMRHGRYKHLRHRDTHPLLPDSSWIGPASRHPLEICT